MRKFVALLFFGLVMAAYSPAPLRDKRKNVVPKPELSQAVVATQQALQKVQPEVGAIERPLVQSLTAPVEVDPDGKNVLRSAPLAGVVNGQSAAGIIERASRDEAEAHSKSVRQSWAMVLVLVFLGGAYGAFRKLADKAIPYARDKKELHVPIAPRKNLF